MHKPDHKKHKTLIGFTALVLRIPLVLFLCLLWPISLFPNSLKS